MRLYLCTLLLIFTLVQCQEIRYDNWQVWALGTLSNTQQQAVNQFVAATVNETVLFFTIVFVSPNRLQDFQSLRNAFEIPATFYWNNFQE